MAGKINPIETGYKGYRFRSRLEARWAVFFDAMGIAWEYEPEGYALPSRHYLPDFLLTTDRLKMFIEVKPTTEHALAGVELCNQLIVATGSKTLILVGVPGEHTIICPSASREDCEPVWGDGIEFGECRRGTIPTLWLVNDGNASCLIDDPSDTSDRFPLSPCPFLEAAYDKAKSARFEHGENPR